MSKRACIDPYAGPMVRGIDVSHHQGTIDWEKVSLDEQVGYVIIRTGDGVSEDRQFARNWPEAQKVGLRRGTYQYWRATRDVATQADLMMRQIEEAGGLSPCDLPPVCDLEEAGQGGLPIAQVLERMLDWLQRIEKGLGRVPMIYTGQYWHWQVSQARPDLGKDFGRYPLWVPSYGTPCARMPCTTKGGPAPWKEWAFWQYSNAGSISGISGKVDMNYFHGDEKALSRFAAASRSSSALSSFFLSLTPFGPILDKRGC